MSQAKTKARDSINIEDLDELESYYVQWNSIVLGISYTAMQNNLSEELQKTADGECYAYK